MNRQEFVTAKTGLVKGFLLECFLLAEMFFFCIMLVTSNLPSLMPTQVIRLSRVRAFIFVFTRQGVNNRAKFCRHCFLVVVIKSWDKRSSRNAYHQLTIWTLGILGRLISLALFLWGRVSLYSFIFINMEMTLVALFNHSRNSLKNQQEERETLRYDIFFPPDHLTRRDAISQSLGSEMFILERAYENKLNRLRYTSSCKTVLPFSCRLCFHGEGRTRKRWGRVKDSGSLSIFLAVEHFQASFTFFPFGFYKVMIISQQKEMAQPQTASRVWGLWLIYNCTRTPKWPSACHYAWFLTTFYCLSQETPGGFSASVPPQVSPLLSL